MKPEDLEFVRLVDRLGREGKTQDQIAEALGESSKWAIRQRLENLGFRFSGESRVRDQRTRRRLEDMLAAGELVPQEPACAEVA